jgi:hypothetical protein
LLNEHKLHVKGRRLLWVESCHKYYAGENVRFVISIAQSRRSAFRPNRAERRMSGFWSRRRRADHRKSTHIGRQSRMPALGKMSSDLGRPIWVESCRVAV